MSNEHDQSPRGIAVVDVGYTNCKVILYDAQLNMLTERKITSPHHQGLHYRDIDVAPMLAFAAEALNELDAVAPVDAIVPCAHGACIVSLRDDGTLSVPAMDYMSEPPAQMIEQYKSLMPSFAESYSPLLPMALLHGMQLFWQQTMLPDAFSQTRIILPLMQYVAHALGGRAVREVSSMSCQSHLVDMRDGGPSSLSRNQGWDKLFAPKANAWDIIGQFNGKGSGFKGHGNIHAGVHDSNANFLRYLASGQSHFTLMSTGTWIIGFDTDANMTELDPARDIVANKSVFGRTIACSRFFGGKEYEILAEGTSKPSLQSVAKLIEQGTFALPSFTDSGGPMPGRGGKGRITGPTPQDGASLASLYCALMVSESLDALKSKQAVIVDGPFSQNDVFLSLLAALRRGQTVYASEARDGTAAGAACLALMPEGKAPHIEVAMRKIIPADLAALSDYQTRWREQT